MWPIFNNIGAITYFSLILPIIPFMILLSMFMLGCPSFKPMIADNQKTFIETNMDDDSEHFRYSGY